MATKINYEDVKKILMNTNVIKRSAENYRDSVLKKINRLANDEPKPPYHFIFAFEDKNDMEKFIKRNRVWFTPWSETTVKEYGGRINHMRFGYYYDEEHDPDYTFIKTFINDKIIGVNIYLLHVYMSSTYINNLSMDTGSFEKTKAYRINRKTNKKESAGWLYRAIYIYNKETNNG